jgi:hypothetical protein
MALDDPDTILLASLQQMQTRMANSGNWRNFGICGAINDSPAYKGVSNERAAAALARLRSYLPLWPAGTGHPNWYVVPDPAHVGTDAVARRAAEYIYADPESLKDTFWNAAISDYAVRRYALLQWLIDYLIAKDAA